MFPDISRTCLACRRRFWVKASAAPPEQCPECRQTGRAASSLAVAAPMPDKSTQFTDVTALFADLHQLLAQVGAPLSPLQTVWDWWQRIGGENSPRGKLEKAEWANLLVKQKTALMENLKAAAMAAIDLQRVQDAAGRQVLQDDVERERASIELLKLRAEQLRLEEGIAQQQALRDERIQTQRLEEIRKQFKLLNEIEPRPAPLPATPADAVKQAIGDHRQQFKAKATAKQLVISDFLRELQKVFRANLEDPVKAVRIRAVLEAYKQEVEALPKEIRQFVERVERSEGGQS
jgi:hypothetical protein